MRANTFCTWIIAMLLALTGVASTSFDSDNLTYINNPEVRKMTAIHLNVCGYTQICNLSRSMNETSFELTGSCGPCHCYTDCFINRTCCPDLYEELKSTEEIGSRDEDEKSCVFTSVSSQNSIYSKPKLLVTQCPVGFSAYSSISRLCQSDYYPLWRDGFHEYAIPVTDKSNHRQNYKNMFCAMCHGLGRVNVTFWTISIISNMWFTPYLPFEFMDINSYLSQLQEILLLGYPNMCLIFGPPTTVPTAALACNIDHCNETGLWKQPDNFTERACQTYNTGFVNNSFANVFCAMCNGYNISLSSPYVAKYPVSYMAFIDINDLEPEGIIQSSRTSDQEKCGNTFMYDPIYDKCRQLHCCDLFHPYNYTCKVTYSNFTGIYYMLLLHFKPKQSRPVTHESFKNMEHEVQNELINLLLDINQTTGYDFMLNEMEFLYDVNVSYSLVNLEPVLYSTTVINITLTVYIELRYAYLLPHQSVRGMIKAAQIIYTYDFFSSHLFRNSDYIYNFLIPHNSFIGETLYKQLQNYLNNSTAGQMSNFMINLSASTTSMTTVTTSVNHILPDHLNYEVLFTTLRKPYIPVGGLIYISPKKICPFIYFYPDEYIQTSKGFKLSAIDQSVHEEYVGSYSYSKLGTVSMCVEKYIDIINHNLEKSGTIYMYTTETILSLACSSISVMSLLITILIYGTVKDLQTLPGCMLICLCLNLLCSQGLYVLTNTINISISWLCRSLGLLLHFTSLSYLFWMNISTFHMLKAFTSINLVSKMKKTLKKYLLYVHGCATFFLLLNVIVQLVITKGEDIGYGGKICYINTPIMVGITSVLPLSIAIIANTIMFVLAIRSVVTADDIIALSNRKYILIFTKLSTLTGITWIFGLMYQWSRLQLLAYIFIILNASQGVFILIAFTFNQRMYRAIKRLSSSTNETQ